MNRHDACALAGALLAGAVCFLNLGPLVGMSDHECYVAQTAREMRATGDWIVPQFSGMPRVRKPPLPYWCVAALSYLTGQVDEWTARLPSALAGVGNVLCACGIARLLFGTRIGAVAAWVTATSIGLHFYAHQAVVDMQLTFWCSLCYLLFFRWERGRQSRSGRWWAYGFFVALGVAMLAKAPVPLLVVGGPIGLYAAWSLRTGVWTWRDIGLLRPLSGGILFAAIAVPWWIAVYLHMHDASLVWDEQIIDRFSGDLRSGHEGGVFGQAWYYLPVLAGLSLPWTLSLPEALAAPFMRAYSDKRRPLVCIWLWLIVTLVVVTAMAIKRKHYILPAMPATAILLAVTLDRCFLTPRARPSAGAWISAVAISALSVIGWIGGYRYVQTRMTDLLPVAMPAGLLLTSGAVIAALLYARDRRGMSLFWIGATSLAIFQVLWPGLGPRYEARHGGDALHRLVKRQVPNGAPLYWVGQEPRWVYYSDLPVPRLDDPIRFLRDASRNGAGRRDLELWAAAVLDERLKLPSEVWILISRKSLDRFTLVSKAPAHEIALGRSDTGGESDAVVLLTNRPPPATASMEKSSTLRH